MTLLPGVFSTTNTTGYVGAYVHPYVSNWAEKNLPAFWWIYTCLGGEFSKSLFFVYAAQFLMWGVALLNAEKKQGRFSLPNVAFLLW